MSQLDEALKEFHEDLQRAEELLRMVKLFKVFAGAPIPSGATEGCSFAWPEATDLHGSGEGVRTDLPILAGSILLYMCGRFEYFIREVVVAIADDIASKVTSYDSLPEKIKDELTKWTAEIALNPRKFGFNKSEAEQFLISLAKNIDASEIEKDIVVASRVLSITENNMTSRTLSDTLKRVGVTDVWTELGKQAQLKRHLNESSDGPCKAAATSNLDRLMQQRNELAHPTGTKNFPNLDGVLESSAFFRALSTVLIDVVSIPR